MKIFLIISISITVALLLLSWLFELFEIYLRWVGNTIYKWRSK